MGCSVMKKIIPVITIAAILITAVSFAGNRHYKQHGDAVAKQHKQDIKNRDAILRELNAFLDVINKDLKEPGITIETPVESSMITEV